MTKHVLVTGGAGYIGSHTCLEMLNAGYEVTVIDNLGNSSPESLKRVEKITGKPISFVKGDIRESALLNELFSKTEFEAVVHFAGMKAVGESTEIPLEYFDNNVSGTVSLMQAMETAGVKRLIFSSSATVYGDFSTPPFNEEFPLGATNPYGRSKLMVEDMCREFCEHKKDWQIILLRYFNPVGAHESGEIGEDPSGIPNNLMPFITQVAVGKRDQLKIFGSDYDTKDGSAVRDYIHVVDLAKGHLAALDCIDNIKGCEAINLGAGQGYTVLEVVESMEKAVGKSIPHELVGRRPGDIAASFATVEKAAELLKWKTEKTLDDMCVDSWNWQKKNPEGYGKN